MLDFPIRFWKKVRINPCTQCWEWQGYVKTTGYGTFRFNGKTGLVHRFTKGAPDSLEIDHLCRNRSCCNPAHLEIVTHSVNMQRGKPGRKKGIRTRNLKTHCIHKHEFKEGSFYINKHSKRVCRQCSRERPKRAMEKARSEFINYEE